MTKPGLVALGEDQPYEQWLAELERLYGKRIARVIANAPPPRRKKAQVAKRGGKPVVEVRGHAENPDAPPSAVDFRHHRARIESGK